MSVPAPRPREPAQRPAHHLRRALEHHQAHRRRVHEQAAEQFKAATRPPQSPPGGK